MRGFGYALFYFGGNVMALIKCPECSKDVSNKAKICPNCGYPVEMFLSENRVEIKLLPTEKIIGGPANFCTSRETVITAKGCTLWKGRHGETAVFNVAVPTVVTIDFGVLANPAKVIVEPNTKYELVYDIQQYQKHNFKLSEIE